MAWHHQTSETYTASAELKEDVDIIRILKKCVEANDMLVAKAPVNSNLLWHLQKPNKSSTFVNAWFSLSIKKRKRKKKGLH